MKYIRKTPCGPAVIYKRLASLIWRVYFPKKKNISILKRIHRNDTAVYCLYDWRRSGRIRPPRILKSVNDSYIKNVTSCKKEIVGDSKYCVTEVERVTSSYDRDGARVISRGNEFFTEVAVSKCLDKHVNQFLPSPTFCTSKASWTSRHYGNIAMEYAGETLSDCIHTLSTFELKSIILQVGVALSWAQKNVHFKHHDLHSGNIYVMRKPVLSKWTTPSGYTVVLPATNVRAVISDFGLSAATDPISLTRHCRIDYDSLNIENKRRWGEWNSVLEGNEGYDFLYFIREGLDGSVKSHIELFKEAFNACKLDFPGIRMSKREGRPLVNIPITPERFLQTFLQA